MRVDLQKLLTVFVNVSVSDLRSGGNVTALYRRQRAQQVELDEVHPLRQTLRGAEHDGGAVQVSSAG